MQSIESIKKSFPNERQLYHDCLQNHDLKSLINFNNERLNRNKFSNSTTKKIHELIAYFNKERIKDCAFSIPYMFESTMPNILGKSTLRNSYFLVQKILFDGKIIDKYPEYLRRRLLNILLFIMKDYSHLVFLGTAVGGSAIYYSANKWWSNKKKRHSPEDIKTHLIEDFSKILDTYVENYGFEKQSVRENEKHLFLKYKMKIPFSLKEVEKKERIKKLKQLFQIIPKNVFINELIYDGTSLIPLEKQLEIDDLESKAKTIKKYGDIQLERYYFTHPKTLTQRLKNYLKKRPEFSPNVKA